MIARASALVVLMAIAAMIGCADHRLDLRNTEAVLASQYSKEAGVDVDQVRCPKDVPTREGYQFECTIAFAGGTELVIAVEQLGKTQIRWQPKESVSWVSDAKSEVRAMLTERGHTVTELTCPAPVYISWGKSVICVAKDPDGVATRVDYAVSESGQAAMDILE